MKGFIKNYDNGLYNIVIKDEQDKIKYQADMFNDDLVSFMDQNKHINYEVK
jgi:hypothetical protein